MEFAILSTKSIVLTMIITVSEKIIRFQCKSYLPVIDDSIPAASVNLQALQVMPSSAWAVNSLPGDGGAARDE